MFLSVHRLAVLMWCDGGGTCGFAGCVVLEVCMLAVCLFCFRMIYIQYDEPRGESNIAGNHPPYIRQRLTTAAAS